MRPLTITYKMFKNASKSSDGLVLYSEAKDGYVYSVIITEDPVTSMMNFIILMKTNDPEPRVYRQLYFYTNIFFDDINNEDFRAFYHKDLNEVAEKMNKYLEVIQTVEKIECPFDTIKFE